MKLKALALVAAVLMTASCFAACSNTEKPDNSKPDSSNASNPDANVSMEHEQIEITSTPVENLESTKTNIDTSEEVNLLWYQWGDPAEESEMVYEELNKMSKEAINTTVDYQFADNTKANLIISTDEYYDMVFSCAWQTNYVNNANKGVFAELDEILPVAAPILYNFIPELVWQGATVNDHIYMVPTFKDSAAAQMWRLDKSIVEEAGITEAELDSLSSDFASMAPLLEKIKNNTDMEGAPAPFAMDVTSLNYEFEFINRSAAGIGVPYGEAEPKVVSILENKDSIEKAKVLSDWYAKGYIDPDVATVETHAWAPTGIGQGWLNCEAFWQNAEHGDVVIRTHVPAVYTTDSVIGSGHAISVNSDHIERALLFLQWINTDFKARNVFYYGIEGTHWNLTDEGTVEVTPQGMNKYRPSSFSQGTFFTIIPEAPKARDSWDGLLESCMKAEASPLLGFTPNNEVIETEIAAADVVWKQHEKKIIYGLSKDPEADMAAALEALNGAGLQNIIDEYQSQVDAFLQAK